MRCLVWLLILALAAVIFLPLAVVLLFQRQPPLRISTDRAVRLYLPTTGSLQVLPLEEYLVGVVAAEMPARFGLEALKAQAVASRTYAVRRLLLAREGKGSHRDADLCNDAQHCQGWLAEKEMQQRWGFLGYWFYRRKVAAAVAATRGQVLTYEGRLIDAAYHAASGGRTEDAAEVWGTPVPYLRSVPSPWEEEAPQHLVTVVLPAAEVARRLGLPYKPGHPFILRPVASTVSGRVKSVRAGDRLLDGPQFRQLLGLNSTFVTWEQKGEDFIFKSRGYGHGVGMSQYGAAGLARRGKSFREILAHYYPGTALVPLEALSLP